MILKNMILAFSETIMETAAMKRTETAMSMGMKTGIPRRLFDRTAKKDARAAKTRKTTCPRRSSRLGMSRTGGEGMTWGKKK